MIAASNRWSPGAYHGTCELQDGRPVAGEIAGVKLCQRDIDVVHELAEKERERVARLGTWAPDPALSWCSSRTRGPLG